MILTPSPSMISFALLALEAYAIPVNSNNGAQSTGPVRPILERSQFIIPHSGGVVGTVSQVEEAINKHRAEDSILENRLRIASDDSILENRLRTVSEDSGIRMARGRMASEDSIELSRSFSPLNRAMKDVGEKAASVLSKNLKF